MSWWGTLEAEFRGGNPSRDFIAADVPTGSESGPSVSTVDRDGAPVVWVEGRLRDVDDTHTSPAVLAWFTAQAQWCDEADLLWELDAGPRYRYEWRDGELRKLKGVLDL
jgi:hypothetical protein